MGSGVLTLDWSAIAGSGFVAAVLILALIERLRRTFVAKDEFNGLGARINVVENLYHQLRQTIEESRDELHALDSEQRHQTGRLNRQVIEPLQRISTKLEEVAAAQIAHAAAVKHIDGPRVDVSDITRIWTDRYGSPNRIRNALGELTELDHADSNFPALVTEARYANGRTLRATYDPRGNIASATDVNPYSDGRDAVTLYTWDAKWDAVTSVILPDSQIRRSAYNATNGVPLYTEVGDSTRRTVFAHNANGLVIRVTEPGASRSDSVLYDALGNVQAVRTPIGFYSLFYRDLLGRDTLQISPRDSAQSLQINDVASSGVRSRTAYDVMDRILELQQVASSPAETLIVRNVYDSAGNLKAIKRASRPNAASLDTLTTLFTYDAANRKIKETDPTGARDSMMYDPAGNLTALRTRRSDVIGMRYDVLNRLTHRYEGGDQGFQDDTARFAYDAGGNQTRADNADALVHRTYFRNGLIETDSVWIRPLTGSDSSLHKYGLRYRYDRSGRRTTLRHPVNLAPRIGASPADSVRYTYDPLTGELASVTDPLGTLYRYEYDLRGRLGRVIRPAGSDSIVESFVYDEDSRITRRYEYSASYIGANRSGQPSSYLHDDTIAYDARSKLLGLKSVTEIGSYTYTGLGYVSVSEHQDYRAATPADWGTITDESFGLDALGNVTSIVRQSPSLNETTTYSYYSGSGRLHTALQEHDTDSAQDSSLYDSAGNRTFWSHNYWKRRPNAPPDSLWMAVFQTTSYTYRADQKLTQVQRSVPQANSTDFTSEEVGLNEIYRYDALGRRVLSRSVRDVYAKLPGVIQRFVWDGDQLLYEMRYPSTDTASAANLERDTATYFTLRPWNVPPTEPQGFDTIYSPHYGRVVYTHGLGIDEPLSLIRMGMGKETSQFGNVPLNVHLNFRGLVDELTDPTSGVSRSTISGLLVDFPARNARAYLQHRGTGEQELWAGDITRQMRDASGQLYKRNRYFDPMNGVFTQEDPIGLAGGINIYNFAGGDPVNFSDGFGLCPICAYPVVVIGQGIAATLAIAHVTGKLGRELDNDRPQIFHRRTEAFPKEIDQVLGSSEIWGGPTRNIFAGVTPMVKAFLGPLPKGVKGYEFTTNVKPDPFGVPWKPTWSQGRPGVEARVGSNGEGMAAIRVRVVRVQRGEKP